MKKYILGVLVSGLLVSFSSFGGVVNCDEHHYARLQFSTGPNLQPSDVVVTGSKTPSNKKNNTYEYDSLCPGTKILPVITVKKTGVHVDKLQPKTPNQKNPRKTILIWPSTTNNPCTAEFKLMKGVCAAVEDAK
jgi:hypothetical protein